LVPTHSEVARPRPRDRHRGRDLKAAEQINRAGVGDRDLVDGRIVVVTFGLTDRITQRSRARVVAIDDREGVGGGGRDDKQERKNDTGDGA